MLTGWRAPVGLLSWYSYPPAYLQPGMAQEVGKRARWEEPQRASLDCISCGIVFHYSSSLDVVAGVCVLGNCCRWPLQVVQMVAAPDFCVALSAVFGGLVVDVTC